MESTSLPGRLVRKAAAGVSSAPPPLRGRPVSARAGAGILARPSAGTAASGPTVAGQRRTTLAGSPASPSSACASGRRATPAHVNLDWTEYRPGRRSVKQVAAPAAHAHSSTKRRDLRLPRQSMRCAHPAPNQLVLDSPCAPLSAVDLDLGGPWIATAGRGASIDAPPSLCYTRSVIIPKRSWGSPRVQAHDRHRPVV